MASLFRRLMKRQAADMMADDDDDMRRAIAQSLDTEVQRQRLEEEERLRRLHLQRQEEQQTQEEELSRAIAQSILEDERRVKRQMEEDDARMAFELQNALPPPPPPVPTPEWICEICTMSNELEAEQCVACDAKGSKKAEDESYLREYWQQLDESAQFIVCLLCNTQNRRSNTLCTQCMDPLESQQVEKDSWHCAMCTFENISSDTSCFMCGNPSASSSSSTPSSSSSSSGKQQQQSRCGIPGCQQPAGHFGFCCAAHLDLARKKHIVPASDPLVEVIHVGPVGDYTAHLLRSAHPRHASVRRQFLAGWKHPVTRESPFPRVERIYWIMVKPQVREAFKMTSLRLGNVQMRWHGTMQSPGCLFGTDSGKAPCASTACRVCNILRTSFSVAHSGAGPGAQRWAQVLRYGKGLYFSPVSSKSNDYNGQSERLRKAGHGLQRRWRCMFLCSVAVGNAYHTKEGRLEAAQCPPAGYDSVIGETGGTGPDALNYDECVVYTSEQAIPTYLIVYSLAELPEEEQDDD